MPLVGIDPHEGFLVAEQQRFVARVEIGGAEPLRIVGGDAAGAHEVERLRDAARQFLVAVPGGAVLHEAERPLVDAFEVRIAALREGSKEIERRRRLPVSLEQPLRIGRPRLGRERDVIDDVAPVARQFQAVLRFRRRGARLGELPGDAPDLHHGAARREGQHHRHLQEHAEEIANGVRAVLGEAFRAIPALQDKSAPGRNLGEVLCQAARLPCKNQRREARKFLLDGRKRSLVGIHRDLLDRFLPPAVRCPTR